MTLMIIFLLLYLNFRRIAQTLIAMLSLPFALVGGLSSKAESTTQLGGAVATPDSRSNP